MNGGDFVYHITVWLWPSIMISMVSWDDKVVQKTCWFDLDFFYLFTRSQKLRFLFWPWPFRKVHENLVFCAHCTMNGGHFVDPIAHWTVWLWPSIMISIVSWDDEVVHKTCWFDLDLSLILLKVTNNLDSFPFLCRGFDSVGVTLLS